MSKEELLKIAKPILFNTEMVQAIMDGRKTVTRRVVPTDVSNQFDCESDGTPIAYICQATGDCYEPYEMCRYTKGDILYVRETWNKVLGCYVYKASYQDSMEIKWKPSIHMPKEAARIFLKVKSVRVERLQDITEEQAEKEGCNDYTSTALGFCYLWDSTIKKQDMRKYGWYVNPYVWVIGFERIEVQ